MHHVLFNIELALSDFVYDRCRRTQWAMSTRDNLNASRSSPFVCADEWCLLTDWKFSFIVAFVEIIENRM